MSKEWLEESLCSVILYEGLMCQKWSGMSEISRTSQLVHMNTYTLQSTFCYLYFSFITMYEQITWTEISLCWNGGTFISAIL